MDPSSCMICSFSGPGLHRFPRDKKRLKDWLVAIERNDLLESEFVCSIVYNSGRVCKAHFSDSCFCGKDKKKLLKNALPRLSSPVKKKSTAEDKCPTTGKKVPALRKYRNCKKLAKNVVSSLSSPVKKESTTKEKSLSSPVKKESTTKEKCSTTGKKAPDLRKYRYCKKLSKNAVPSLSSPVKKKSTTKEKCSTTVKKEPDLRKYRYDKKLPKNAVASLSNAVKNKSKTKKRRISENAQECNARQGDNNAVSEKSSYVNIEMESSDNIEKEPSVNIKKEPSDNIEMESSDNIEKESSVNIKKESSVNIEKESSVNIEKEPLVSENPSIEKELGAEIPNNQSITCEESKTKDVNRICPMKTIFQENVDNVVSGKKEPEKILGATKVFGELLFLVKWKGANEADLLPSTFLRKEFSELLIQFYEDRLEWAPPPSGVRRNWC